MRINKVESIYKTNLKLRSNQEQSRRDNDNNKQNQNFKEEIEKVKKLQKEIRRKF